jgi:uncharacterized delta-60 repeat protein
MKDITACIRIMIVLLAANTVFGQPFLTDLNYGIRGVIYTGAGQTIEKAAALLLSPNGSMTLVGNFQLPENQTATAPAVQRLLSDGTVDITFGRNGSFVFTELTGFKVETAIMLSDGRILIGGTHFGTGIEERGDMCVARLLANGFLDRSFGQNGFTRIDLLLRADDRLFAMATQPDGKILALGRSRVSSVSSNLAVLRLHQTGAIDTSFAQTGKLLRSTADPSAALFAVSINSDGNITVAGRENNQMLLWRLRTNGTSALQFGVSGVVRDNVMPQSFVESCVNIRPMSDGSMILGIVALKGDSSSVVAARYTPSGGADLTFGQNGHASFTLPGTLDAVGGLGIMPDGKIIISGDYSGPDGRQQLFFGRFLQNGSIDSTFSTNGRLSMFIEESDLFGTPSMHILPNGTLLHACTFTAKGGASDFGIMRLLPNGMPDEGFAKEGLLNVDFGIGADSNPEIFPLPNGNILLANRAAYGSNAGVALQVLQPDGTRDRQFGRNGRVLFPEGDAYSILLTPGGKILVSLSQENARTTALDTSVIVCLNPDGTRDTEFKRIRSGPRLVRYGAMHLQPDGKLLAFITSNSGSRPLYGVARFMPNGAPDVNFGSNGLALFSFSTALSGPQFIRVWPTGHIIVGCTAGEGNTDFAVFQLTSTGSLTTAFGRTGLGFIDFSGGADRMLSMQTFPATSTMLFCGSTETSNGQTVIGCANYLIDGSPNLFFGPRGLSILAPVPDATQAFSKCTTAPNGQTLFSGRQRGSKGDFFTLTRLRNDAKLDTSFGEKGVIRLETTKPFYGITPAGNAISVADGRILWCGHGLIGANEEIAVTRLRPNVEDCRNIAVRTIGGQFLANATLKTYTTSTDRCRSISTLSECIAKQLCFCPIGVDSVRAFANFDKNGGISTFDIALIAQHLINNRRIVDPYAILAADVNRNNAVTNFDIVELRKFILGIYDSLPGSPSWRFVDRSYVFPNVDNPFAQPIPNYVLYNTGNPTLVAIKIGDVDNDHSSYCGAMAPAVSRYGMKLSIETPATKAMAGAVLRIPVTVQSDINLSAWQCHLSYTSDRFKILTLDTQIPNGQTFDYYDDGQGNLRSLWYGAQNPTRQYKSGDTLFTLVVQVLKPVDDIASGFTLSEAGRNTAFESDGTAVGLLLERSDIAHSTHLKVSCSPNPVDIHTTLSIESAGSDTGVLAIRDASGRSVYQATVQWLNGRTSFDIDTGTWAGGVYFWHFAAADGQSANGRLVKY